MGETDDAFDLDMAAATVQSNATDVHIMLKVLAGQLAEVLGPRVVVERAGGILRKSNDVKALEVTLGDDVLRAQVEGASVRCSVAHSSGGIRIRSESVDLDTWLKRLLAALQQEAAHSEGARQALERIVIGGSS
ncbi:MAG TPA: hypothetical protein VK283_07505 [Acidimicrobiales bacterium]|nr:hypothetical protein [Acidimicrobiales bacterium]